MSVVALEIESKLQERLENYFKGTKSAADLYSCDINQNIFFSELGIYFDRLSNAIKETDAEETNRLLSEIRSYANSHLYGISNFGDRRYIGFYDSGVTGKREVHVTLDELKVFIASEIFTAEKIGEEQAVKAQNIFYPLSPPSPPWLKKLGFAGAIAASFALGRCSKEDNHQGTLEKERTQPAAEAQRR